MDADTAKPADTETLLNALCETLEKLDEQGAGATQELISDIHTRAKSIRTSAQADRKELSKITEANNSKSVTLNSLKSAFQETSERGNQLFKDIARCLVPLVPALFTLVSIVFYSETASTWSGALTVSLTLTYMLLLLLAAAHRSDVKMGSRKGSQNFLDSIFPTRVAGIFLVLCFLASLVVGFAALYMKTGIVFGCCNKADTAWEAIYFSFVTLTTLGYGDFFILSYWSELLIALELLSGIVLLICIFALLIARLSVF